MELRHIRYLLAVADHGSFTRAAEALHISQPTLSQQIRQLERTLGVPLLDRAGRTVRLTDAGEAYLHHAQSALRELAAGERAVHDVQDLSRGQLRIALTPTFTPYFIGPLVHRFRVAHPGVTLTVWSNNQDQIEADLLADRIDLGIGFAGDHAAGIAARTLYDEPLSLVVGVGHRLAAESGPVPIDRLEGEPLALLSTDFATRGHVDAYFAECAVTQRIAVEANSISALLEFVRHGALATVLPDAVAGAQPELHRVPLDPPLPTRTVQLLQRAAVYRSAAARAFTELVLTAVAEQQAAPTTYWSNQ